MPTSWSAPHGTRHIRRQRPVGLWLTSLTCSSATVQSLLLPIRSPNGHSFGPRCRSRHTEISAYLTPVHAELVGHETPLRALAAAPGRVGVDWTAQMPPLRRSASVTPSPDSRTCKPTAVHTEVARQDTALSTPFPARGFGLGTTDHPRPDAAAAGCASTAAVATWPPGPETVAWAGAPDAPGEECAGGGRLVRERACSCCRSQRSLKTPAVLTVGVSLCWWIFLRR